MRQQIEHELRDVRQQLASCVRSNGITSLHLSRLLNFRRQVSLANPEMSSAQLSQLPSNAGVRLGKVGLAGGASGLTGGITENLVAGNVGSALARQLTSQGTISWMASSLGRGIGGAAGGGVAAPVFSMAMLALDDQEHSTTDYVATGTRAAVAGTLGGALELAGSGRLPEEHLVFLPDDA